MAPPPAETARVTGWACVVLGLSVAGLATVNASGGDATTALRSLCWVAFGGVIALLGGASLVVAQLRALRAAALDG